MWAAPLMQCCLLSARAGLKQRPVWLLLLPAQTEPFKVAAGGCHPPCVQWKKKRRQRGGQRGDLHWEEEDEVGNRGKEEQNQRCRAGRKVNPAVSINHCRTERKSLQWCWDEAVQGAGSAPSVVSIHQCQQTDIPCSWIWSHLMPSLTPGAMAAYPSGNIFCSRAMCTPKGRDNLI